MTPSEKEMYAALVELAVYEEAVDDAENEVVSALEHFPRPAYNAHEAYAILLEEVDELWDQVKVKQGKRDLAKMRKEAIQVAAMAIRFAAEVCSEETGQR